MADQRKGRSKVEEAKRVPMPSAGTQQPEAESTIDLVEMMFRLLSKWKLILSLALVLALAAALYTSFYVTPMYQATSTIYVLSRSDSAINMSDLQIGTALTKDYIKVFSMWEVHEKVISNLNLPYSYSQMRSRLSVVNDADTRMLDITFSSPSPEEAAAVANEYARVGSAYIAETMSTDKPNIMSVAQAPSSPVSSMEPMATGARYTLTSFTISAATPSLTTITSMITARRRASCKSSGDSRRKSSSSVTMTAATSMAAPR